METGRKLYLSVHYQFFPALLGGGLELRPYSTQANMAENTVYKFLPNKYSVYLSIAII